MLRGPSDSCTLVELADPCEGATEPTSAVVRVPALRLGGGLWGVVIALLIQDHDRRITGGRVGRSARATPLYLPAIGPQSRVGQVGASRLRQHRAVSRWTAQATRLGHTTGTAAQKPYRARHFAGDLIGHQATPLCGRCDFWRKSRVRRRSSLLALATSSSCSEPANH